MRLCSLRSQEDSLHIADLLQLEQLALLFESQAFAFLRLRLLQQPTDRHLVAALKGELLRWIRPKRPLHLRASRIGAQSLQMRSCGLKLRDDTAGGAIHAVRPACLKLKCRE